ncbi:membrane protein [Bacterioplanes sanyensis]|uniref:TolC family protein n=1 Tax=Bacterioplanes sanyensis TaxID=1249553 RepID=UPI0016728713|nr:TolC family protein [Bacterioplanes sanyensis]GGY34685.1 membrane protein [Bacterioplanes sanyensis]
MSGSSSPIWLLILVSVTLTGCSSMERPPQAPGLESSVFPSQGYVGESRWWQALDDPALLSWVKRALQHNPSLQAAQQRYQQALASARASGAGRYPNVEANLGRSRNIKDAGSEQSASNAWSAGLSGSYELDIWGRVNALAEQGQWSLLSQSARARLQANSVASEIALAWYGWQMESARLTLLVEQRQRLSEALQAIEGRFRRGLVSVADVWQQQQLLEANQAEQSVAEAQRQLYWQTLVLWVGGDTQGLPNAQTELPQLTALPQQVSSEAILQRPDVEAAWYQLQSADAGLAAAVASRYPRLSISASLTSQTSDFADLFDNWLANLAANLVLPLIDGGQRRAEVARNQAVVQEQLASYRQTWLQAAREVQQAMILERRAQQQVASVGRQLALARKNEAFQASRYRKGVADFLVLLNAQQDVLQLENQLLQLQLQQLQYRINFYTAVSPGVAEHLAEEKPA